MKHLKLILQQDLVLVIAAAAAVVSNVVCAGECRILAIF